MNNPILQAIDLTKRFVDGKREVTVLQQLNFNVYPGERLGIVGASGSGKSTLLHLLGGLDKPSSGSVLINGKNITEMTENERSKTRNETLGFVYQFHHLLPEFTVLENVCMPLLIRGLEPEKAEAQATILLDKVGLNERHDHKLGELSGGERQRTAIARALVASPLCLLADEPTGNLDHKTAERVYQTMLELNRDLKTSLIIVTHDMQLAEKMDRVLTIIDGKLIEK